MVGSLQTGLRSPDSTPPRLRSRSSRLPSSLADRTRARSLACATLSSRDSYVTSPSSPLPPRSPLHSRADRWIDFALSPPRAGIRHCISYRLDFLLGPSVQGNACFACNCIITPQTFDAGSLRRGAFGPSSLREGEREGTGRAHGRARRQVAEWRGVQCVLLGPRGRFWRWLITRGLMWGAGEVLS